MSLIHEALEKLDGEKQAGWKKTIPISETPAKDQMRSGNSGVIYGIAGVLLFFFLAGLVYFLTTIEKVSQTPRSLPKESVRRAPSLFHSPRRNQFILTGVTRAGAEWTAIINNELVRVGEGINGATVRSIEQEGVTLDLNGEMIKLSLYGDSSVHFSHLEVSR